MADSFKLRLRALEALHDLYCSLIDRYLTGEGGEYLNKEAKGIFDEIRKEINNLYQDYQEELKVRDSFIK